jgi:hypothetical protein
MGTVNDVHRTEASRPQAWVMHGPPEGLLRALSADSAEGTEGNQLLPSVSFSWQKLDGRFAMVGVMRVPSSMVPPWASEERWFDVAVYPVWREGESSLWDAVMESVKAILVQLVARYQFVVAGERLRQASG